MSQISHSSKQTHYRTCPICEATCGLAIDVVDNEVSRIRGDDQDVFSKGFVCPKGTNLGALHQDTDRLRTPLIKQGESFTEASWEEAFEAVDRGLQRVIDTHGRQALAAYLGNPNAHNFESSLYTRPLLKSLGTRNIFSASTVDQMPRHVSSGLLYGSPTTIPVPDLDRTAYLLMLGANPFESNGSLCTAPDFPGRMRRIQQRGGRIVVVDPRRTRTAEAADEHLPIRPGTDVFFLLSLARVLTRAGAPHLDGLEAHLQDLELLVQALEPFEPQNVAPHTGLDASTIERIALELSQAESGAVYGRIGVNTVEFGTLSSWAADVVTLLAGHFDRPGGLLFSLPAHARPDPEKPGGRGFRTGRFHSRVKNRPEVMGELPVATLSDELETPREGQIRGLLTVAGNPVLSTPNGGRLDPALAKLDFMVSVDIYLNETTRHADVILPPPSALERGHYDIGLYGFAVHQVANYSPPIFDADGPSESEILARLALIASGQGPHADPAQIDRLLLQGMAEAAVANPSSSLYGQDPESVVAADSGRSGAEHLLDLMLRGGAYGDRLSLDYLEENPHGIDLGAMTPRIPQCLKTPSGRIELMPKIIASEIERAQAAIEASPSKNLVLIGRRHVRSNNSWLHNIEKLVKGRPRCTLLVHPEDAERAGLSDGQTARIRSRVGSVEAPVEVTESIREGVVSLPHGWGHSHQGIRMAVAKRHAGVNSNLLTDEALYDPPSGNAVLNGIPVAIEPAGPRA